MKRFIPTFFLLALLCPADGFAAAGNDLTPYRPVPAFNELISHLTPTAQTSQRGKGVPALSPAQKEAFNVCCETWFGNVRLGTVAREIPGSSFLAHFPEDDDRPAWEENRFNFEVNQVELPVDIMNFLLLGCVVVASMSQTDAPKTPEEILAAPHFLSAAKGVGASQGFIKDKLHKGWVLTALSTKDHMAQGMEGHPEKADGSRADLAVRMTDAFLSGYNLINTALNEDAPAETLEAIAIILQCLPSRHIADKGRDSDADDTF